MSGINPKFLGNLTIALIGSQEDSTTIILD